MAPVSAFKRISLMSAAAVAGGLLVLAGSSVAVPQAPSVEDAVTAQASAAVVPDPLAEHAVLVQAAREATTAQAVIAEQQAQAARAAADAARKAEADRQAAEAAAAQAAAAQAAAAAAAQAAAAAAAAAQAAPAQPAADAAPAATPVSHAAPAQPAAPAGPPTAYIPVAGSGGQAAVNACQGPIRFTPVTVSVSIVEHDFCGGWSRMSWIQPGTVVTVQGYGTFTAFQRMVVSQGASEYVVGNFAGGYPPIFLQTCIPGTDQMLLIGLH
ncbi:LysM domain-containing protein [Sinomonas albida]|uniref:LysM domain-containing protein n=1 Tax=Sinomonas albida TaxID=369942 RepID=UPI001457E34E|nr:LysM domain-containing protein [Sinomonas albida]